MNNPERRQTHSDVVVSMDVMVFKEDRAVLYQIHVLMAVMVIGEGK